MKILGLLEILKLKTWRKPFFETAETWTVPKNLKATKIEIWGGPGNQPMEKILDIDVEPGEHLFFDCAGNVRNHLGERLKKDDN